METKSQHIDPHKINEETVPISGLDCPDCALKVEKAIQKMPGVKAATVNFTASNLYIEYDPTVSGREKIFSKVEDFGYEVGATEETRKSSFRVYGLDCPDCSKKLERKIASLPGVDSASLVYETGKLTVKHHEEVITISNIIKAIESSGYGADLEGAIHPEYSKRSFWISDKRALTVIVSAIPLAIGGITNFVFGDNIFSITLLLIAIAITGYRPTRSSISSLKSRVFDMNVLMTIAVVGAVFLRQWTEAATVMFLFAVGTMLEAYTMDKTRHAIRSLLEFAPSEAAVKRNGDIKLVPVEDVHIGDIVVVKPGERIPVDGKVIYGRTSINQSAITGESLPITKNPGDLVYAGTLNHEGYIEITTIKQSQDTTLSHIIHLVEEAQSKKAPSQRFIDRFSAYYTPSVIAAAILIAAIPPIIGLPFITWIYRALVLLVIACPCALVISTPVSVASAIGAASRSGVLIKGGSYLEQAGQVSTVVFDKTGTLTSGRLSVTDIVPLNGYGENEILAITSSVEARSGHPLAEAVVNYAKDKGLELLEPANFTSMPGLGLKAEINDIAYYVGNPKLFSELKIYDADSYLLVSAMQKEGKTVFMLGTRDKLLGIVAVADKLRAGARQTVKQLREIGIANIIMLTGDNAETAREIASQVDIDDYRAELLPEEKIAAIESISQKYGKVAMVGDGVNDAPAISRADVGIAMGAIGSDIALEISDIALMADELSNLPYTIKLSRRALRIIKQNVTASIAVKLGFIALGIAGLATLWMAVFADTGIAVLVILNGMRLFAGSGDGPTGQRLEIR